ncbi:S66 peptidase family protein [Mucilaginibacter paludis]|uniref:Peptidase U61 LD-carboxypeptidase A n=1 Tax=Mucilaginibacter paludis DSM 18603 TaxID=714943 RepID=H1Y9N4_9SPHI|nr:LD-carboxypeptidase [Mucilaginibacter paludis]EHQ30536.1 peptidase U61 LD-carboxypeptidase A [Mucilaginibacter paludis DSM 18603]
MNRKYFISSVVAAGVGLSTLEALALPAKGEKIGRHKIPPFLKSGDCIGISSPAGFMSLEAITPAVQLMESWGFKVLIGTTVGKRDFTYGGTDEERLADFQQMLDNPDIKAVMCARGGYGLVRIIDRLNFKHFVNRPKWIIGFSDVTVLHCHINQNFGIASVHSKMCNSFPDDWATAEPIQVSTILSIKQALMGEELRYPAPAALANRAGRVEGKLVGGNLSIVANLAGTPSDLVTKHKILFLEDTGEYLYNIDRMFWNLKRTGKLTKLAGLIIGGFKVKPDDPGEEFGKTVYQIVMEKVKDYDYPVCFDFPVGHQRNNFALRCGMPHLLDVSLDGSTLSTI